MATRDERNSSNVLLHTLCCRILQKSEAEVFPQFQYAIRVVGSNFYPTVERDEFLVAEKIKKELVKQDRARDAALFAELHRKLQSQGILHQRWAILYLLLGLAENPRKSTNKGFSSSTLFTQALAALPHSTPLESTSTATSMPRPSSLPLAPPYILPRSGSSCGRSGFSSITPQPSHGPTPTPESIYPGKLHPTPTDASHSLHPYRSPCSQSLVKPTSSTSGSHRQSSNQSVVHYDSISGGGEVSEFALVRDLIYVFQGIDGHWVHLNSAGDAYCVDSKAIVSPPLRGAVARLSELGWLHNRLRNFIEHRHLDSSAGLMCQSFCAALHQELKEYYRLLSVLHSQLQVEEDQGVTVGHEEQLTMRRLLVWTYEPRLRLKTLAALVDHCQGCKGGALATAIHAYTLTGDPLMKRLSCRMLSSVASPLHALLIHWIIEGELDDPCQEFFVAANPAVRPERLWHDKYSLRKPMIPSFISTEQARQVLSIGKSINFLHHVCGDRTLDTKSKNTLEEVAISSSNDGDWLLSAERVRSTYECTAKHLLHILSSRYQILEHIGALRRYLLLGQGDFIRHLMDLLKPELLRPATSLYQHNLTGILETAVRATNAQFDSTDVLRRVDVRLFEVSEGDTGWDVFSLEYHVNGPIATVFTEESMKLYRRAFHFLWHAKRTEHALTDIWTNQMCNGRLLHSLPELFGVLHQCNILAAEMIHFVHQMQYYITFEVLECSWASLLRVVHQAGDLDHILAAHHDFLDAVISRCLLEKESWAMLTQLRTIFDRILAFQGTQEALHQTALSELGRRLEYRRLIEQTEEQREWGVTAEEERQEKEKVQDFQKNFVPKNRSQLRILTQAFQAIVQKFLIMLASSTDESLRFLSFRLDFNEHYSRLEPGLRRSLGSRPHSQHPTR
uniref:gamma-tubulin complex component 3 isoform X2 n=1 Tax=Myxine glutinosa TaxID=7769 RepID=UPI00358EC143